MIPRLSIVFFLSILFSFSTAVFSQEKEKPIPNDANKFSSEPAGDSDSGDPARRAFEKKIEWLAAKVNYFFGETLGFRGRTKRMDAYLQKELHPYNQPASAHRFIFTPITFSGATFTIPEQQESQFNSAYSSARAAQSQQSYRSYTRPQNGGSEVTYTQLEYRLHDRLRLFYIHRSTREDLLAIASNSR